MRAVAWLLVALGLIIAIGGTILVVRENNRLYSAQLDIYTRSMNFDAIRRELTLLNQGVRSRAPGETSPGATLVSGLVVSAFGVLVLAIRRPEPKTRCPECDERIRRSARNCRYCGSEVPRSRTVSPG